METGENRCAGWIAGGRNAISPIEENTFCGEAFHVRRFDRVVGIEQSRPIVHVIDSDEENVGLIVSFGGKRSNRGR